MPWKYSRASRAKNDGDIYTSPGSSLEVANRNSEEGEDGEHTWGLKTQYHAGLGPKGK